MKPSQRMARFVSLFALLALFIGVFGVNAQDEANILIEMSSLGASDLPTADPALATDSASIQVIESIFVPLVRLNDQTSLPEPGMATSWELSDDGSTLTFTLLEGVPWVRYNAETGEVEEVTDEAGEVRYVTAQDFAYGIARTLDPRTAADYAGVLAPWVAGGAELIAAGEAGDEEIDALVDALGVEVVDDYTLTVTSANPAGFLPSIFGLWITSAQPSWLIEEAGDTWITDENIQSFGPFVMAEWNNDENVLLLRNPFWPGTDSVPVPALDGVDLRVADLSTAQAAFEAGEVDFILPNNADLPRVQADPELSQLLYIGPSKYTYYYGFDTVEGPMADPRIRRAFSMAIDRQLIIDRILQGGQSPANFFTYPTVVGAPTLEAYPEGGVFTDLEAAQTLFDEYLADTGLTVEDIGTITLSYNESQLHSSIAQAVQQMWADAFGVDVQLTSQEWGVFLEQRATNPTDIYRSAWGYDYPDANSFLYDVFHSSSGNNDTRWNDPEFDTVNDEFNGLLEQARALTDPTERAELYAQAEQILVYDEAAIAPVYYYTTIRMIQPYVEGQVSVLGTERFEKWSLNR